MWSTNYFGIMCMNCVSKMNSILVVNWDISCQNSAIAQQHTYNVRPSFLYSLFKCAFLSAFNSCCCYSCPQLPHQLPVLTDSSPSLFLQPHQSQQSHQLQHHHWCPDSMRGFGFAAAAQGRCSSINNSLFRVKALKTSWEDSVTPD